MGAAVTTTAAVPAGSSTAFHESAANVGMAGTAIYAVATVSAVAGAAAGIVVVVWQSQHAFSVSTAAALWSVATYAISTATVASAGYEQRVAAADFLQCQPNA